MTITQALCDSNYQCENCFTVSIASNVKIATENNASTGKD